MLTRQVLFGMNLVTVGGFLLMAIGLTLNRQRQVGTAAAFALMGAGTALVFLGLYLMPPANS